MRMEELYMHRCLELASLGKGFTAPNPLVGAVLVHDGKMIGEGYHRQYGQAHAEVNCINNVSDNNKHLIEQSTLYVSLEPCAHFGKTPPCSDLIIEKKIPKVVIGCRDPFKEVNGKGIDKLQRAGVEVLTGVLETACKNINKRFFVFHTMHRPYIILKWAQTADNKTATHSSGRLFITNEFTNRLVHRWRSEEAAILIGTNTALMDDPSLNNRLWIGHNPVRLVMDMNLRLPSSLKIFNPQQRTIIFNKIKQEDAGKVMYYRITEEAGIVHQVINACYRLNIQSILVEGGTKLLQSFIDDGYWDEARIITNTEMFVGDELAAPRLSNARFVSTEKFFNDSIQYFIPA